MPQLSAEMSFEQFEKHEKTIQAAVGTNESTTRLLAIDTMLFDVLGWEKTEVETEKYNRAVGYSDYAFIVNGSVSLILEAKRQGKGFVLPELKLPSEPIGFSLLTQESPEAEKALRQVIGYAAAEGARYVAISNGHQWLLMQAFIPNVPVDKRSVFVFESLEAIKEDKFRLFHSCFGPEGIRGNLPADKLLENRKAPAPSKLSSLIINYPVTCP